MATTYNLMYRVKGSNSLWTLGPTGLLKQADNTITGVVNGLNNGTTYEFRFRRVVDGALTDTWSNSVEATPQGLTPYAATGTTDIKLAGTDATLVRDATKLRLQLTANWSYVRITGVTPTPNGKTATDYFVRNSNQLQTQSAPLAGSTFDTQVINRIDNKTVDILLNNTHSYVVIVQFNGNSSGSISIGSY